MSSEMVTFGQAIIDTLTWFLMPFAFILAISWAFSFFRKG